MQSALDPLYTFERSFLYLAGRLIERVGWHDFQPTITIYAVTLHTAVGIVATGHDDAVADKFETTLDD